eukprot:2876199-Prymnesium_polylepis.1
MTACVRSRAAPPPTRPTASRATRRRAPRYHARRRRRCRSSTSRPSPDPRSRPCGGRARSRCRASTAQTALCQPRPHRQTAAAPKRQTGAPSGASSRLLGRGRGRCDRCG